MNINYFLAIVLRKKYIILGATILAMVATFILISKTSKKYISKAQLETGIANKSEVSLSEGDYDFFSINNKFSNFIEQITSKQVISLLSYQLAIYDLEHQYTFKETKHIKEKFSQEELNKAKDFYKTKLSAIQVIQSNDEKEKLFFDILKEMEYDVKSLEKSLEINRVGSTDYVEIKYTSKNPYLSAFVVNTLCNEIIRFYNHETQKKMNKSVEFFSNLATQKKQALDNKIDSLNRYKRINSVTNFEEESKSKLDQISSLETERDEATKKILALNQTLETIEIKLSSGQNEDFDTEYNNNKTLNLRSRIGSLTDRFVSGGSKDKRLKDSIQILKEQLNFHLEKSDSYTNLKPNASKEELKSKKINTELEIGVARSNLATIERSLSQLRGNLSGFSSKEASISELQMAINVAKDEYISINDKFNSSKNASLNSGQLLQVEFGEPADEPEPSKTLVFTLLSGIIITLTCIAYLFLIEYFSDNIKTPSHAETLIESKLIGVLNQIKTDKIDLLKAEKDKPVETFKYLIRNLRHTIETATGNKILFTSVSGGEGKTFVITQLAKALGLNGKKVLIIDTNLKKNSLTSYFNAKPFLSEQSDLNNLKEALSSTNLLNVSIIGCKTSNYSPDELFLNNELEKTINFYAPQFDYIFLESANTNKYSDSLELCKYVDLTIAILSSKISFKSSDKTTLQKSIQQQSSYLGTVLNNVLTENIHL
ncbi:MAG: hypothetical protein EAZ07_06200 [Cytophagales bacterium]|nr:MAG: hypothetical protein EAZ07_06200 [Cytophagales bacterium]